MKVNVKYFLLISIIMLSIAPQKANAVVCWLVGGCDIETCDGAIRYSMKKQKKDLKERLEDLKKTINENTEQTEHQTKIIEQEVLAYRRLLVRIKKETLSLQEGVYLSKQISNSEILGTTIDISKKGK